jgi:hypothetical protein
LRDRRILPFDDGHLIILPHYIEYELEEERFGFGLWCSPRLAAARDKKVKCADQFGTVWTIK